MRITAKIHKISLVTPFVIARGARSECLLVRVSIRTDKYCGVGECTPYTRYNENADSVLQQITEWSKSLQDLTPEKAQDRLQDFPPGAARNALDCALWDLRAKAKGQHFPYHLMQNTHPIETAMTISIDTATNMGQQAARLHHQGVGLLKVKLDAEDILERVAAVRHAAPNCKIILDANEAWLNIDLEAIFHQLNQYDIAMIEQPLPSQYDKILATISHPIPLCADESCHVTSDLKHIKNRYEMVNIKLDKTGGLTHAMKLTHEAQAQGLSIMIGCMLGTSMAMKAALPLIQFADLVDLDGPVLLGSDIEDALHYGTGMISIQ